MSEPIRSDFLQRLERAFANTPYPGDDNITKGAWQWIDTEKLLHDFKGKHWSQLPRDILFLHRDHLYAFTPDAFRFYLPAFLRAVVLYPDEMDTLHDSLFFHLIPPESAEAFNLSRARIINELEESGLSPSEIDDLIRPIPTQTEERETDMTSKLLDRAKTFNSDEKKVILTYFESYAKLYPEEAWVLTDRDRSGLQRAVDFWKAMVE